MRRDLTRIASDFPAARSVETAVIALSRIFRVYRSAVRYDTATGLVWEYGA